MLKDEMEMLKSTSMKVDDSHIMVVAMQYHSEKTDQGKRNTKKSMYRYFAKVLSIEDWQKKLDYMFSDEHRLEKFKIQNDPSGYYLVVNKDCTNYNVANWLEGKIRKVKSWEDGQKILKGFKNKTASHEAQYVEKAKYLVDKYQTENGDVLDITDVDALLKHVGQNLIRPCNI